jgi:hypothetical protein
VNVSCPACSSSLSFKSTIIPIFQTSCAIAGCHDSITHQSSLNLDSAQAYATATEPGTGNVTPGDAGNSLMYTLLNAGGTNGMPKGLPPLAPCEIQEIECWINQGAKNN